MTTSGTYDLLITGRIATLEGDGGFGWAEALAIGDGRILAAGGAREVEGLGTPSRTWRLGDRAVAVPGVTDAHLHLLSAAQEAMELGLHDAPDRQVILDRIAAAHAAMTRSGDDGWLLGHGWSLDRMGTWPTVEDLERVAPGRAVALWAHDHHTRWVSDAALRAAGIGRGTTDPEGGLIRRDGAGTPTGILHEHAGKLVSPAIPRPSDDRLEAALRDYAARLAGYGVVAAHDPGEMADEPELHWGPTFYRALAREGRLPLRVAASIRPEQLDRAIERGFHSADGAAPAEPGDPDAVRRAARYRGGWLKQFADGSLGSRSAALLELYEPEPDDRRPVGGPAGMLLDPSEVLAERAQRAIAADIAVQIHGIGDAAVRAALDILARLPAQRRGVRHRIEHAQLVDPADVARFGELGIVASVQPSHMITDAEPARRAWGRRTANAFPLRSIAGSGGLLAFGTDAPVESPDPWPGIGVAVARDFHPEQSIDFARALRAACLGPAQSAGEVDRGRLVAGQVADLIVLPAEVLDEPVHRGGALARARPVATLIDGEVVYRDPAFDTGD